MEVLDGDDVRLSSRGRKAERDIVQVKLLANQIFYSKLFRSIYEKSVWLSSVYVLTCVSILRPHYQNRFILPKFFVGLKNKPIVMLFSSSLYHTKTLKAAVGKIRLQCRPDWLKKFWRKFQTNFCHTWNHAISSRSLHCSVNWQSLHCRLCHPPNTEESRKKIFQRLLLLC